ncbi:SPOSA6832_01046, partial [Sporobolomyces salmonicolor]
MAEREPARTSSSSINGMIREAKGLALELKGMLKRKDPWDREVEFQREALRKAYLRVVFSPPSSFSSAQRISTSDALSSGAPLKARSSSVSTSHTALILERLNVLWLDTSHALIQIYRHRLSELDKAIAEAPRAHKGKNKRGGNGGDIQLPPAPGPVARRKLLHSFRQFLGAEEEFWRTLCGRFASRLYPEEADELRGLGILASAFSATSENDARHVEPSTEEEKKALRAGVLPLAHKALICFGDLARYSELYSDGSGSGFAALKERGGKRGGKQGGGADRKVKTLPSSLLRTFHPAYPLSTTAGNPSNQLAVLAQYAADPLSSAYHYYRALSVRTPFDTARANLQTTFKKALQRWFSPDGGEPEGDDGVKFKAAFVAIQGILFTKQR